MNIQYPLGFVFTEFLPMETFSSFLKVLLFATLCFAVVFGLAHLIFSTPLQISFTILTSVLGVGLIWLHPFPLISKSFDNTDPPITNATIYQEPTTPIDLSYRGIKYTAQPELSSSPSNTSANNTSANSSEPDVTTLVEVIGKYRGSPILGTPKQGKV
jgi:hypothetical protein